MLHVVGVGAPVTPIRGILPLRGFKLPLRVLQTLPLAWWARIANFIGGDLAAGKSKCPPEAVVNRGLIKHQRRQSMSGG